jgi:hypothetical protein
VLNPTKKKKSKKKQLFEKVIIMYPVIMILVNFLIECYKIFDNYSIAELDHFIDKYKDCEIVALARYANGLHDDYEAVKNSLIYKNISNGPLEGVNSRIKMKHRRGGGRSGIELLNAYNVLKVGDLAKCSSS